MLVKKVPFHELEIATLDLFLRVKVQAPRKSYVILANVYTLHLCKCFVKGVSDVESTSKPRAIGI